MFQVRVSANLPAFPVERHKIFSRHPSRQGHRQAKHERVPVTSKCFAGYTKKRIATEKGGVKTNTNCPAGDVTRSFCKLIGILLLSGKVYPDTDHTNQIQRDNKEIDYGKRIHVLKKLTAGFRNIETEKVAPAIDDCVVNKRLRPDSNA